ncbi:unnamed protein product [Soboliphyme baturini]|uniref:Fibronectin type-III domain-containing protein n=1 Tax=Soboliphyme baturini TaxID=241478 RepID=A0A3P8E5U4_9BILA|nr:unnamed protein product [Soboliphyme baturini]
MRAFHVKTEKKTSQETFEAIVNLSPWVNYTFRVIAVNRRGAGLPGYKRAMCNTPPSYPYTNPEKVSAAGDQPDNLVIYWEPMDKMDWNGDRFRYLVRYKLDEPGAQWEEFEVEDPLQNSVTIRDQPTFRKYLVQVVALNAIGRSLMEPQTAIGYSGEDVPLKAPKSLKIAEIVNSTAVRLQWEHVDMSAIRGHFQGYKIQSWLILTGYQQVTERLKDVLVPANSNTVLVDLYEPMNTYEAVVVAYNGKFDGPPGEVVYFTMPEGAPSAVRDLTVKSLGSSVISSKWNEPAEPRGRLRGYYLSFSASENNSDDKEEETWVPYPRSSHLFESAKADTAYIVSVWAETGGGEGAKTSMMVKTWGYENPGKPEMKLNLLSSSDVEVTWIPSEIGLPGTAFMVNYSMIGSGIWQTSDLVPIPENRLIIKQLKPNFDYTAVLIASDGDRYTESDPQFFRTVNTTILGQVVTIEKSLTGIAWFIAVVSAGTVAVVVILVLYVFYRNRGGKYSVKKKEIERGTNLNRDEERCFMEYQYGCGSSDITT